MNHTVLRRGRFAVAVGVLLLSAGVAGAQNASDRAADTVPATAPASKPAPPSLVPKPSAPDLKPFTLEDRYFDAARRGDLPMLEVCIQKGIDPKIKDELGRSALALAVRDARDLEMAEFLQARGAAVDDPDSVGRTPLHEAAGNGDTAIVAWLLEQKVQVGSKDMQGRTPLHSAVMGGSRRVAELLLAAGADPNARDNFQDTSLLAACSKELDEIAKLLVEKGADPSLKDQEGRTARERSTEAAPYCHGLGAPKPAA